SLLVRELRGTRAKLLAFEIESRDRAAVSRGEIRQHRHRLDGIATIVHRQQQADVTEPAEAIESDEPAAEKFLLLGDSRRDRSDLRFEIARLLLQIGFDALRHLELARPDIELDRDFFQFLLRGLRLRADIVQFFSEARDVAANAV